MRIIRIPRKVFRIPTARSSLKKAVRAWSGMAAGSSPSKMRNNLSDTSWDRRVDEPERNFDDR